MSKEPERLSGSNPLSPAMLPSRGAGASMKGRACDFTPIAGAGDRPARTAGRPALRERLLTVRESMSVEGRSGVGV